MACSNRIGTKSVGWNRKRIPLLWVAHRFPRMPALGNGSPECGGQAVPLFSTPVALPGLGRGPSRHVAALRRALLGACRCRDGQQKAGNPVGLSNRAAEDRGGSVLGIMRGSGLCMVRELALHPLVAGRRAASCRAQPGIGPLKSWSVNASETAGYRIPSPPEWGFAGGSNREHVGSRDRIPAELACCSGSGSARMKERVWPQHRVTSAPVRPAPCMLHRRVPTSIDRRAGIAAVSKLHAGDEQPLICPSRVRESVSPREGPWAPPMPSGAQCR